MAAATSALVATSLLGTGPARSAPVDCPTPVPPVALSAGDPVTGLSVTSGTTPTGFTGTIQGVLEDGIAPGVDMILADLHSAVVDRVGIWSGMSGSPVYDADGDLIGAVSYSLGLGPSTVAGITPATEMATLLTATPPPARTVAPAGRVALPPALQTRVVRSGAATAREAGQSLTQIRMPLTMSGLSPARATKLATVLERTGRSVVAGVAGPTSSEDIPVQAGGNLAASLSYGTVTYAGIGTATMVCGGQVVGFGHPMQFNGPSTMNMHGARALLIQDDSTLSGFKVANIGAPVGVVTGDHQVGINGLVGPSRTGVPVTSWANEGDSGFRATTHVTEPGYVPDLALSTVFAAQDKVLDRIGAGTAWATWTVKGTRKHGKPFRLERTDLYTDDYDVSSGPAYELGDELYQLQDNDGEAITITSVDSTTRLYEHSDSYAVAKVQGRVDGDWRTATRQRPLQLRAGTTARLRVILTSRTADTRARYVEVAIPDRAAGRRGTMTVRGGNRGGYYGYYYGGGQAPSSSTFPDLVRTIENRQQHNQVRATTTFRGFRNGNPTSTRRGTTTIDRVVGGRVRVPVIALP